jgi:hypothetical protein
MKNLKFILVGVFCLVSVFTMKAQDKPVDYFAGKWNVMVTGTPNGDAKMLVTLERVDGKLSGTLLNSGQGEPTKFSRVEEKENSVTLYFTSSGYDVYLQLEKKDENIVKGSMMDMFDATGERIIDGAAK